MEEPAQPCTVHQLLVVEQATHGSATDELLRSDRLVQIFVLSSEELSLLDCLDLQPDGSTSAADVEGHLRSLGLVPIWRRGRGRPDEAIKLALRSLQSDLIARTRPEHSCALVFHYRRPVTPGGRPVQPRLERPNRRAAMGVALMGPAPEIALPAAKKAPLQMGHPVATSRADQGGAGQAGTAQCEATRRKSTRTIELGVGGAAGSSPRCGAGVGGAPVPTPGLRRKVGSKFGKAVRTTESGTWEHQRFDRAGEAPPPPPPLMQLSKRCEVCGVGFEPPPECDCASVLN